MLSYVLLCTLLSHFFLFLIIRLIYRTFTVANGWDCIGRRPEQFYGGSVYTRIFLHLETTLSNALS